MELRAIPRINSKINKQEELSKPTYQKLARKLFEALVYVEHLETKIAVLQAKNYGQN